MPKRLTRDTRHSVLGGVAAGFGEYFDLDPVLVRLVFILLALLSGFGVVVYLVCWLIMPRKEETVAGAADEVRNRPPGEKRGRVAAGSILILLGVIFLLDRMWWWHWPRWLRLSNLWPVVMIVVGAVMIWKAARGQDR